MNFRHDLATKKKKKLHDLGVQTDANWSDHTLCVKFHDIKKRFFYSHQKYNVVYSDVLIKKISSLSLQESTTLQTIRYNLENQISIFPYLSRLIKKNSTKNSDFMLKNWNIYHTHLGKLDSGKQQCSRTKNLLFFTFKGNTVYFIDVKSHPKGSGWFDKELIEIIYDNWKELLNIIQGGEAMEPPNQNIFELTKKSVVIINIRGVAVLPTNLGVASSGDSNEAVRSINYVFNTLRNWEVRIKEDDYEFRENHFKQTNIVIPSTATLHYELIIENDRFFACSKEYGVKIRLLPL